MQKGCVSYAVLGFARVLVLFVAAIFRSWCDRNGSLEASDLDVQVMLRDLFGAGDGLQAAAKSWRDNDMHAVASKLMRLTPSIGKRKLESALWLRLTRILYNARHFKKNGRYDISGPDDGPFGFGASISMVASSRWHQRLGASRMILGPPGRARVCGETGDGHLLAEFYHNACPDNKVSFGLSAGAFDREPMIKFDLNGQLLPEDPDHALLLGIFDLIVSAAVFEHISHPATAFYNINRMLRGGGRFILEVPFLFPDHGVPQDFSRWTVDQVRRWLMCAGFAIKELRGRGNVLAVLGVLADVPGELLGKEEVMQYCDAQSGGGQSCADWFYHTVQAVGIKWRNVTVEAVRACAV